MDFGKGGGHDGVHNRPVIILDDSSSESSASSAEHASERGHGVATESKLHEWSDVDSEKSGGEENQSGTVPEHANEKTEEKEINSDEKDQCTCDQLPIPEDYAWIHKGSSLNVVSGNKRVPYPAKTLSDPFFWNAMWLVRIQWDGFGSEVERVECSRCESIDLTMDEEDEDLPIALRRRPEREARKRKPQSDISICSSEKLASFRGRHKSEKLSNGDGVAEMPQKHAVSCVARMPQRVQHDDDDDPFEFSDGKFVSPSPMKKARYGFATFDTDDESIKDKKPAARRTEEDLLQDTDSEDERNASFVRKRLAKKTTFHSSQEQEGMPNEPSRISMGMEIRKRFGEEEYRGVVTHSVGVDVLKEGKHVKVWKVEYDDGDSEGMEEYELLQYRYPRPATREIRRPDFGGTDEEEEREELLGRKRIAKKFAKQKEQFEAAKQVLCGFGVSEEEAELGLHAVGPPYDKLQTAMQEINKRRGAPNEPFRIREGMEIRKPFDGDEHIGFVTHGEGRSVFNEDGSYVKIWKVLYEDGDQEDLEEFELLRYRYPPPKPQKCRGRQMQFLELFCGRAVVSQEFRQRQWKVVSVDICDESNASIKKDILVLDAIDLPFVPDCIWASPPCDTYSNMAAGCHRSVPSGKYEKSKKARHHNFLFAKMAAIMRWAQKKHPHLVVCIENPVGSLAEMPLMKELVKQFGLHRVQVNYCAFGRSEKKPTIIWTNFCNLSNSLRRFNCKDNCLIGQQHELVQSTGHIFDHSVIPQPLAEEVAAYVDAEFILKGIRWKEASLPGTSFGKFDEGE